MNFDEFIARVVDEMRSRLLRQGDGSDIRVNKVLKNNGVELTAMNVCKSSEEVCPTIYLDPFYRDYEQGMDFDVVMEDICRLREANCRCRKLDIRDVVDETKVMDNIILRLVNRERNSRLLESAPFIEFNDLAITFRRVLSLDNDGLATTIVNNNDVKRWRVSLDTLYKNALKNTQRMFPCVRQNLFDALKGRFEGIDFDDDCDNVDELYMLSNTHGINGATAVLYDGMLEECANMVGDDIYILPSSVHELLFIRASADYTEDYYKDLIREANKVTVSAMDYLSDSLYMYSREKGKLLIV